MVADTDNRRVQVFSVTGAVLAVIGDTGGQPRQLLHPLGVAVTPPSPGSSQSVVVTDGVAACVKAYSLSGDLLDVLGDTGTFALPYGVALSHCGQRVLVTDLCHHSVTVLSPNGRTLGRFGQFGDGPSDLDHPYFLAVDSRDTVIVSNSGTTTVKLFTMTGQLLRAFSLSDFRLPGEHFLLLHGVAVDTADNILVVGNSSVYVLASDGRLWEVLVPDDGIQSPRAVCSSPRGYLVLSQSGTAESGDKLSVFRYISDDFLPLKCLTDRVTPGGGHRQSQPHPQEPHPQTRPRQTHRQTCLHQSRPEKPRPQPRPQPQSSPWPRPLSRLQPRPRSQSVPTVLARTSGSHMAYPELIHYVQMPWARSVTSRRQSLPSSTLEANPVSETSGSVSREVQGRRTSPVTVFCSESTPPVSSDCDRSMILGSPVSLDIPTRRRHRSRSGPTRSRPLSYPVTIQNRGHHPVDNMILSTDTIQ